VKAHYNLYYLYLEEQEKHPLSTQQSETIRKNIEKYFEKIKPPWKPLPLISSEQRSQKMKSKKKGET
jgi:hypothetical protein